MTTYANEGEALHAVLAGWLVRREGCTPEQAIARHGVDNVLAACEREGVVSLVHARLSTMDAHPVPVELMQPLAARARLCAARSLLCVAEARRIQQALDAARIPALWLKGIALAQWLYPAMHLRDIADIDLLLPDHATTLRAAQVLAPLGYTLPNPHIAGDLVVHELLAWSERARLELDLHWDLSNPALFAGLLPWAELAAGSQPLPGLGGQARGLGKVHALLHACLHRAVNMLTGRQDRLRWLLDIHWLVLAMDNAAWMALVRAASEASLADATAAGLKAAQQAFGTPLPPDIVQSLEQAAVSEGVCTARLANWHYFQRCNWRALPGMPMRLRWLRQSLLPNAAHLRVRYGADGAHLPVVVLRRLGDAWRRWRGWARPRDSL